jgi:hypothetical protein
VANDSGQIEDQGDATVAHNGGTRADFDLPVESAERLDDGLMTAKHTVDNQADALVFMSCDDDFFNCRLWARDAEELAQADVGN